ncbi:zf-HC2 domain-containing protein [Streptomyces sp. M600PL45_2]|uniref:Zf-HC2 domain-containing protein n=1 Tax=Streptomyces marispadix TaxID=2922868 RepID=A0ABS9SXK1_9ACTN|nr:zf-HC2 domain-containing protein [Streptomyces marispadix]MCH6160928.1 zf-HC2 domain-containing protein [Streptomyces marispadix]
MEHDGEQFDHRVLKSLLGAWALSACSPEETAAVEGHLSDCGTCAEEALRLRDAVGLLHPEDSLDLDPMLRSQVLRGCMVRRAPRIPVPDWASPYDAETARLDALLRDMADAEWLAPVMLRWFDGSRQAERETTVGGVIAHLLAADGVVATALGLPDPLDARDADAARSIAQAGSAGQPPADGDLKGPVAAPGTSAARPGARHAPHGPHEPTAPGARHVPHAPAARTEQYWRSERDALRTPAAREPWREQGRAMVRTVSFAGSGVAALDVDYGDFALPVRDAMLDRAFECWMHAEDIADAIDYPYTAPQGEHMHHMVDLAARLLPGTIAWRRRTGLSGAPHRLTTAGAPGRALHLEVEGDGGGDWYIPLDSPAAAVRPEDTVAHVALDRYEFCQLVAGHVQPLEAAAGQDGDREAVRDVLFAAASLSRM